MSEASIASKKRALQMLSDFGIAFNELVNEQDKSKLHYRWRAFVSTYKLTTTALYQYSMQDKELKKIGYRLKNREKNSDVLSYIQAARNADEHAEDHSHSLVSQVTKRGGDMFEIGGGAILMDATSSIFFSNSANLNGVEYGSFSASGDGKIVSIIQEAGKPKIPMRTLKGGLELAEKIKGRDGKIFKLPRHLSHGTSIGHHYLAREASEFITEYGKNLRLL